MLRLPWVVLLASLLATASVARYSSGIKQLRSQKPSGPEISLNFENYVHHQLGDDRALEDSELPEPPTTPTTTEPTTTPTTPEPPTTPTTTEPPTTPTTTEPPTTPTTTEPPTTPTTTEPPTTPTTTETPTTPTTTEPPTTPTTTEPPTTPTTTEPPTTPTTTEPPTTPTTTEPPTTPTSTEPPTTPTTTEPPTTPTTTEPPTTPSTTEPPTTPTTTEPPTTPTTTEPPTTPTTTEPPATPEPSTTTEPPATPEPSTEKDLFEDTQEALASIKQSYDDLLALASSLTTTTISPTPTTTSTTTAGETQEKMLYLTNNRNRNDTKCTTDICVNITSIIDQIQKTTTGVEKWTVASNELQELNAESTTLKFQVTEANDTYKEDFKTDAVFIEQQVEEKKTDLEDAIKSVEEKIDEIKQQDTNSLILVSVIGTVGGLIVIALVGTSVYAFIAKGKKDHTVGIDGPAAHIPMKDLDSPQGQEPSNVPESEPQRQNPYTMQAPREPANEIRRSTSARDPHSAQPARSPPRDIERSASTREGYSDQHARYPPRHHEQTSSSRDPNVTRAPRGLARIDDPLASQSPKKQPPVVPKKPQVYSRLNPRTHNDSSDSNANSFGVNRPFSEPRLPKVRAGAYDERPRDASPYRDPYSQSPQRSGSRSTQRPNHY